MDFIPTVLIKSCQTVFADLIATHSLQYLKQRLLPHASKKAGSAPDSPENYRPISNLNNISKILFGPNSTAYNHLCKF